MDKEEEKVGNPDIAELNDAASEHIGVAESWEDISSSDGEESDSSSDGEESDHEFDWIPNYTGPFVPLRPAGSASSSSRQPPPPLLPDHVVQPSHAQTTDVPAGIVCKRCGEGPFPNEKQCMQHIGSKKCVKREIDNAERAWWSAMYQGVAPSRELEKFFYSDLEPEAKRLVHETIDAMPEVARQEWYRIQREIQASYRRRASQGLDWYGDRYTLQMEQEHRPDIWRFDELSLQETTGRCPSSKLHDTALYSAPALTRWLLAKGVPVDETNEAVDDYTALHWSASMMHIHNAGRESVEGRDKHADICRILLSNGANMYLENSLGTTPLELAMKRERQAVLLPVAREFASKTQPAAMQTDVHPPANSMCSICFENFSEGEDADWVRMACHPCESNDGCNDTEYFHKECLMRWWHVADDCPVCRRNDQTYEQAQSLQGGLRNRLGRQLRS